MKQLTINALKLRARRVRLILLDVDGVLTDGRIYYLPRPSGGFTESKAFHSRDGLGIRFAHDAGILTGIISGRGTPVVLHRARELGMRFICQDARDKVPPFTEILRLSNLKEEEVCYVGDDLVDLPLLTRAGLAVGVHDGHPEVHRHVHYVTNSLGGRGAVREAIELILDAQGKLKPLLKRYLE
jgi:3-deoxy-D-manno-octulosonate 8-phosphate phosphatase (KDO 8-P phosphatase)